MTPPFQLPTSEKFKDYRIQNEIIYRKSLWKYNDKYQNKCGGSSFNSHAVIHLGVQ